MQQIALGIAKRILSFAARIKWCKLLSFFRQPQSIFQIGLMWGHVVAKMLGLNVQEYRIRIILKQDPVYFITEGIS